MQFNVPDMSCGHCTAAIEAAIKAEDPGATVECDIDAKRVEVRSGLPEAAIISTLAEAGYAADPEGI